jgi:hypothetical protein
LNGGVRRALGCPVSSKPDRLETEAVLFKRDSVAVVGLLLYHLTVVANHLSDEGQIALLLSEFEEFFREAA